MKDHHHGLSLFAQLKLRNLMEQFPPNSRKERVGAREPRQVERVVAAGSARKRRRPLGKQFKSVFFSGDARGAMEYMVFDIAIPEIKGMLVDTITGGFERLVLGERAPRRHRGFGIMQGPYGPPTNYGGVQRGVRPDDRPPMPRSMSRQSRARHDFGEIVFDNRQDAEEVLDRMYDILSKHEEVTVSDLYALTGMESTHVDTKWGWNDLRNAGFGRLRGGSGYILDLPEPVILQ